MTAKLLLELVSPERQYISTEVDEVYAPGAEGDLGILPDHAAFFCALRPGEFRYTVGGNVEYAVVNGGFLEVKENKVTVLADGAELGIEIDIEDALRCKLQAEQDFEAAKTKDAEVYNAAEAKLARELIRINVAERYSKR